MKGWEALKAMAENPGKVYRRQSLPVWETRCHKKTTLLESRAKEYGAKWGDVSGLTSVDILADDWEPVLTGALPSEEAK